LCASDKCISGQARIVEGISKRPSTASSSPLWVSIIHRQRCKTYGVFAAHSYLLRWNYEAGRSLDHWKSRGTMNHRKKSKRKKYENSQQRGRQLAASLINFSVVCNGSSEFEKKSAQGQPFGKTAKSKQDSRQSISFTLKLIPDRKVLLGSHNDHVIFLKQKSLLFCPPIIANSAHGYG
jgi:hypothetical protein